MEMTKEEIIKNCKDFLIVLDNKMEKSVALIKFASILSKANLNINLIIQEIIDKEDVILPQTNYIEVSTYIYIINDLNNKDLNSALEKLRKCQDILIDLGSELNLLLTRYDNGSLSSYFFNYSILQNEIEIESKKAYEILHPVVDYDNNLYNESVELLQETYFGKTKNLIEIEGLITIIKQQLNDGKNPNLSKELKSVCNLMQKEFNFENISIELFPSRKINAYTIPLFLLGDFTDKSQFTLVKDKNGIHYKDKTNKSLLIVLYTSLVEKFSSDEIVSIILHEVGHNFFLNKENVESLKRKVYSDTCLRLMNLLIYYISARNWDVALHIMKMLVSLAKESKDPYKFYKEEIEELTKNKEKFKKEQSKASKFSLFNTIAKMLLMFEKFFSVLFSPLIIFAGYSKLRSSQDQGYINEKFADNFANSYGYSQASAQYRFLDKNAKPETYKIPIIGLIKAIDDCYTSSVLLFTDEHPDSVSRLKQSRNKLIYELEVNKRELTKEQITSIEKQIEDINGIISSMSKNYKLVYSFFSRLGILKNKLLMKDTKDSDIYDFDKTFLKDYIEESYYIDEEEGEIL